MRSLRLLALVALLVALAACSSDGSDSPPAVTGADQVGASDDSAAASQKEADSSLPVIVQCVGWSNPEWWGLLTKQDNPYVVYDFHTYSPYDLTHPDCGQPGCVGAGYPGTIGGERWDRSRIANFLFARVNEFQATHGVPILMGELGMEYAQPGGAQFLSDHVDLALQRGWHFCLWNFRSDTRDPGVLSFDYEKWDSAYWNEILAWF